MTEAAVEDPDDRGLVADTTAGAMRAIDPTTEEDPGVRAAGHRALELLGVKEATDEVTILLVGQGTTRTGQDPSHWARGAAASALGAFGGPAAVDALRTALLHDSSQDVRAAAARELGELEDPSPATTERLIDALRDEAGVVRLNARRALREIHGADLGLDPRTWRGWILARGLNEGPAAFPEDTPYSEEEPPAEQPPMDEVPTAPPADEPPVDEEPVDDEAPLVEPRPIEGDEPR